MCLCIGWESLVLFGIGAVVFSLVVFIMIRPQRPRR